MTRRTAARHAARSHHTAVPRALLIAPVLAALVLVITVVFAQLGAATASPDEQARQAVVKIIATDDTLTPAQQDATTGAALAAARQHCAAGTGAPDTGTAMFDQAVRVAMGVFCP